MKQLIKLLPILGVSVLTACSAGVEQNKCKTFLTEDGAVEYKYGQCTTDAYMSKKEPQEVKFERVVNHKETETVKAEEPKAAEPEQPKVTEPEQPKVTEPEKPVEEPKVSEPPKPEPPPHSVPVSEEYEEGV